MRLATALIFFLASAGCGLAEPPAQQLFDGEDLTGWRHVGPGEFVVKDGALETVGGMGLLVYELERIGDAVVRVVFRPQTPASNAGVFIRIPEPPRDPWYAVHHGYEVQIQNESDAFHRTGSIYSISPAEEFPPSEDGWNTLEIRLDGPTTQISVNGKVVNTYTEGQPVPERKKYYEPQRGPRPNRGYIGLQNHDADSTVWFREVSVLPLAEE